jgi:hypothetical protein
MSCLYLIGTVGYHTVHIFKSEIVRYPICFPHIGIIPKCYFSYPGLPLCSTQFSGSVGSVTFGLPGSGSITFGFPGSGSDLGPVPNPLIFKQKVGEKTLFPQFSEFYLDFLYLKTDVKVVSKKIRKKYFLSSC